MFPCDNIAKIKYQEAKRGGQAIKPPRWILSDLSYSFSWCLAFCRTISNRRAVRSRRASVVW